LTAADYIAKWDGTNWSALGDDGSSGGSLTAGVNALAVSGTDLYVGGWFSNVKNGITSLTAADYVAKWDGTNWSALGDDGSSGGSLNGALSALAVSGTDLYVGGWFTNVNNGGSLLTAADFVAKWDGINWSALGNDGGGTPNGSLSSGVLALAVSGNNLYVGGEFTDVNNNGTILPEGDYVAKVQAAQPTAVTLANFSARFNAKKQVVRVKWVTGTEIQVVGFNVWRQVKSAENPVPRAWKQINKQLLAAKNAGGIAGASYSHSYKKVQPGKRYSYRVEIVKTDGTSEWSDVIKVKIP
ncbi:MAG: hypothetical protein IT331_24840, partial [Anaerolineae bacterium]|nr:hypothetical protein [Anaerolineae bacterium]